MTIHLQILLQDIANIKEKYFQIQTKLSIYLLIASKLPLCNYLFCNVHEMVFSARPIQLYEHYKTDTSKRRTL